MLGVGACGAPSPDGSEPIAAQSDAVVAAPLGGAYCDINVSGKGVKALEDDYLPHVITYEKTVERASRR